MTSNWSEIDPHRAREFRSHRRMIEWDHCLHCEVLGGIAVEWDCNWMTLVWLSLAVPLSRGHRNRILKCLEFVKGMGRWNGFTFQRLN